MQHDAESATLHLLFCLRKRPWTPLEGHEAPREFYFELRCLPGNLVAGGDTLEDAESNLLRTLEVAVGRAGSPNEWWDSAVRRMLPVDRKLFERLGGRAVIERRFSPARLSFGENRFVERATFDANSTGCDANAMEFVGQ